MNRKNGPEREAKYVKSGKYETAYPYHQVVLHYNVHQMLSFSFLLFVDTMMQSFNSNTLKEKKKTLSSHPNLEKDKDTVMA